MLTTRLSRIAAAGAALIVLASMTACGNKPAGEDTVRIGIAQIVSHPSLDSIRQGFKDCMTTLGYDNVSYDEENPEGDQAALTSIANNFKSANLDLVVAITTPVAQAMAQAMPDRSIIFAGVTDPVGAGLVNSFEAPGGNLTGTSDYPPIDAQIELIKDIKPDVTSIGVVYSSSEVNAEIQLNLAKEAAAKLGIEVRAAAITNSSEVQQAAVSLKGVDAFYVGNDNSVVSAIEGLIQAAEQQKVPVITADPDSVAKGATASYAVDQHEMGCESAKLADQVLKGAKTADIPVVRMADLKDSLVLTLNPAAAQRQGVTIPDSVTSRPGAIIVGN